MDRVSLLVGTGPQRQVEARVVQEGERMAAVVLHGNVSLEVHLPQLVGFGTLKAHIGCVLGSLGFIDEPMSSENGACSWQAIAAILQHPGHTCAPLVGARATPLKL